MSYKHLNVLRDGKAFTVSLTDTKDIPEVMSEISDFYLDSFFKEGSAVVVKHAPLVMGVVQSCISPSVRSILLSTGEVIECNVMKLADAKEGLYTDNYIVYIKDGDLYTPIANAWGTPILDTHAPKYLNEGEVKVWPPTTLKEV